MVEHLLALDQLEQIPVEESPAEWYFQGLLGPLLKNDVRLRNKAIIIVKILLPFSRMMISRTFLSVGSKVPAGFDPEPEPLSAPLEVELVVL